MTSAEIDAFLSVCEYGNISLAAEKLFISQSSLSTKIKTLEKEIGCTLFIRDKGKRNITLTEEGTEFFKLSIKYKDITNKMFSLSNKYKHLKLRVSSFNSVGTYLFTPVYEQFMQKMPNVTLEVQDLETSASYASLEKGSTDLVFTTNNYNSKKILSKKVFAEPMFFVCPRMSRYNDIVDLNSLEVKNELYTQWCYEFNLWHKNIFGQNAMPKLKFEIMSQLEFFVSKQDSWAIVPASAAFGLSQKTDIKKCDIKFSVPKRVTYCLYSSDNKNADLVSCFMDCLKEHLLSMPNMGIEIYF